MSDGSELDQTRVDALKAVYEQVCDAHNGIADFRAKLLALLPIASGTGIFLLLDEKLQPEAMPHFLGIGIFGAVIALGLFIFELVGIHRCQTLRMYGSALEKKLLPADNPRGRFTLDREQYFPLVKVSVASLTIYPTVIAAWSYVACIGAVKFCIGELGALIISALVLLAFVIIGSIVRWGQERLLETFSTEVSQLIR
jgi:hypothetical protein